MFRRTARSVALCGVLLCFVTACGGGGGEGGDGATDRPSVTGSPTRTLPSPTRSVSVPEQSGSGPDLSPDATRTSEPDAPAASELDPEPTSDGASPSTSPAEEEGGGSADDGASTAGWVTLALLVLATLGTWLVLRARRRRGWSTRLEAAEAEVAWFARDLVPQLRAAASADQVAGGWQVARPRIASAEDQLTVLESSAPGDRETDRARLLRDAVRSARQKLDQLSGPGVRDAWILELDDVSDLLEVALGPPVDSSPT